jgi:predicted CXXCH cytochrome family protein
LYLLAPQRIYQTAKISENPQKNYHYRLGGEIVVKNTLMAVIAIMFLGCLGTANPSWAGDDDFGMSDSDTDPAQKIKEAKAECFSCHTAAGLAARKSPPSGAERLAQLLIDPERFDQSVHADVLCSECHGSGVDKVPHKEDAKDPAMTCPQCHKGHKATIVPEFQHSVHKPDGKQGYTCYSCHDPHNVRKATSLGTIRNVARRDNSMCLDCHNSDARYSKLTGKKRPDLMETHTWQPNWPLHLTAVRCIDCHTPEKPNGAISHDILPKEKAQRFCVDCHSTNSSLLTRLYRYQVGEERVNAAGFVNAYVLTQAYVVGVTRNTFLDSVSLIVFITVLAALGGHGLLRFAGSMARKGRK